MSRPEDERLHLFFSDGSSVMELDRLRKENARLKRQRDTLLRLIRKLRMTADHPKLIERTPH